LQVFIGGPTAFDRIAITARAPVESIHSRAVNACTLEYQLARVAKETVFTEGVGGSGANRKYQHLLLRKNTEIHVVN
jgi:hypothetical protein